MARTLKIERRISRVMRLNPALWGRFGRHSAIAT
jgi:hypothetical protein